MDSLLPNHKSTLSLLPSSTFWISKLMCLKSLVRVPLGPLTVMTRDLTSTVTTKHKIKNEKRQSFYKLTTGGDFNQTGRVNGSHFLTICLL